jgi:hypothetical protein
VFRLEDSGHNPDDLSQALKVAFSGDEKLATGILFRTRADSAYEDHLPQLKEKPLVEQEIMGVDISRLMEELF